MDQAFAMRVFVSVVEEGSFSKAAPRVGITQSSASRYVSALEDELGVQLIQRSTRKLNLSEAGRMYYERARQILSDMDEAHLAIRQMSVTPTGLLRVTAPASFGVRHIAPYLSDFHGVYPDVKIGLSLSDGIQDFIGGGFDLAIRIGDLSDTSLIAARLTTSCSTVCAHPDYLKAAGIPKIPDELATHNCLTFRSMAGENMWQFERGKKSFSVGVSGSLYADNADGLLSAALSGLGIVRLPNWMVGGDIEQGRLVALLPNFDLVPRCTPIQAVYAHKEHLALKIRVFMDFLKERYEEIGW